MNIKQLLIFLCAMLFSVFVFAQNSENAAPASSGIEKFYSQGDKANFLAGSHTQSGMPCSTCHVDGTFAIDDNASTINAKCETCHGNYQALGEQAKKSGKTISAHNGHLVDPSCTACHAGHTESFNYCNNCHVFPDEIPFAAKDKPVYKPEDFSQYANAKPNRIEQTDIVIVGAGGSGIVAALEASSLGKNVILLEKMAVMGGSSMLSSGGINAANTKLQKEHGIEDSVDLFVKDTLAIGGGTNDEALVRILGEGSSDAVDWLTDLGAELSLNPTEIYAKTTVPRFHFTTTGPIGKYLMGILKEQIKDSKVDLRLNSKVVGLTQDDSGRVTGVLVKGKNTGLYEIQADAVILTTGSYANDPERIAQYHPDLKGIASSAQPGSNGDGVELAEHAGAQLIGMEKIQIHPNIARNTSLMITLAMRLSGGILVNEEGVRFIDDNAPRNTLGPAILKQPNQHVYLIYDDAVVAKRQATHTGYVKLGLVIEADSAADLAKKLGLPEQALVQTMQNYAQFVKDQKDTDFDRKQLPEPLTSGKLYAIDVVPAVGGTLGGLAINTDMQVLDENGNPIPSLYASGELVGGWHGDDRYGGNAVVGNIVFGKRVAQKAIEFMK